MLCVYLCYSILAWPLGLIQIILWRKQKAIELINWKNISKGEEDRNSMKEHHFQFNQILLVLGLMVCTIQGRVVQTLYSLVETGQGIMGQIVDEVTTRSVRECSLRWVDIFLLKPCYARRQEVGRCRTRDDSEESTARSQEARDPPWLWNPGKASSERQRQNKNDTCPQKNWLCLWELRRQCKTQNIKDLMLTE